MKYQTKRVVIDAVFSPDGQQVTITDKEGNHSSNLYTGHFLKFYEPVDAPEEDKLCMILAGMRDSLETIKQMLLGESLKSKSEGVDREV